MSDLEKDVRKMMLPNTALNLRESKRNTIKDFVAVGGPLGVSHFIILTATENASYMKVAKTPRVSSSQQQEGCGSGEQRGSVSGVVRGRLTLPALPMHLHAGPHSDAQSRPVLSGP